MSDNHQSYSVMTTQAMAHSASLISHSAMNVDVDDPSQKLGQLSPHASSTSSQSPIIYDASQLGFTTPSSTTYIPQPPSVPFTGRPHTSLSLVQLRTSSIGPERVTRRQQARAHQQQTTSQALSVDNGLSQEAQFDDVRHFPFLPLCAFNALMLTILLLVVHFLFSFVVHRGLLSILITPK